VAPSETFRQFRGRDPSPDALLTHTKLNWLCRK
jgi:Zn-dependent oligopeptidase